MKKINIPNSKGKKTNSNNKKLESIISYSPQTNLETGIKNFIEWYKVYQNIP